ncbi:TonB-dependent receptor [Massilia niabensis]|uniref:TonB-dependent receptor n=1 Tax=Massilia niabensis TaxID=544910 RepID=A0ABW0LBA4_9BURK
MHDIQPGLRPHRLSVAVSLALASLVTANAAMAQAQTPQTPQEPTASTAANSSVATGEGQIATVTVSTRRSQQSSIQRKKNAATSMDSIVAEDVGSLPDRNIGEAISRMSGIALDRGDFGEGVSVAVRGNGPDLTRVEIDGQGVQSAGGTDMNGGGSGRGTEFRQLSADLIKSVDVVKGSTADMTEGALGGGIIIKTRTGLDFKEPFVSVRAAGTQNSLNEKWSPDANVILARKFMDGRLGVMLNASASKHQNESHSIQVATSANQGYARLLDFDNSPQKTFTFNPSTLNMLDPASTQPTASYPYTTSGSFNGATPLEILTRSAAAQSKADCYAAFPVLSATSPVLANMGATNRTNSINMRSNELITCLNQWNDYTPSLVRNILKREVDKRQNLDLRFDFKVNNDLTVYAKGSYNKREVDNDFLTYGLGGMAVNTGGTFVDTNGRRAVAPGAAGAGYFLYPGTTSYVSGQPLVTGAVANVNPASVVVDANHHVTKFGISNGNAGTDQIRAEMGTTSKYVQLGGTFKRDGLTAEFFVGDARSEFYRGDKRTTFSYDYGPATMSVLPNGLWAYELPANFDQSNPANYVQLNPVLASGAVAASGTNINSIPAYTAAQQPRLTAAPQLTWTPRIIESEERTAKLDIAYSLPESIPFFKRFKTGFNLRDTARDNFNGNGVTIRAAQGTTPGIVVPQGFIRSSFVGCENTPGSLAAGGNACKYGFVPNNTYAAANSGQVVMTPADFQNVIAQSLVGKATETSFFNGAKDAPAGLVNNWTQIDVDKVFALSGVPNINYDCVKECKGSDGQVYQQPLAKVKERSQAAYVMADFGLTNIPFTDRALPFGWEIDGNLGYRIVRTKVDGTGVMTFRSITKTGSYDRANPNAASGIVTTEVSQNTAISAKTTDFLPIYNLALWVVPDQLVLRYNRARTVARPPVERLLPAGVCINDERLSDNGEEDQRCTSTVGNAKLAAQRNLNQDLSAEYYPSKDTMFSLSYFKQKGLVGPSITQGVNSVPLFAGSSVIDPGTGRPLSDLNFDYTTWINGVPTTRKGWEFGTKTAFTFLPSILRYTGFDANYTKLASVSSTQNVVDLITGDMMPPLREAKNSYNWALWYDDGRLSARVAVQAVDRTFTCIAACSANSVNNYPNAFGNGRPLPWNPGSPNFRDATRYVDAKLGYKWSPNVEIFVEGRNLGNATTSNSQGQYSPFADGIPNLLDYAYSGRRIMVGLNFRTGG